MPKLYEVEITLKAIVLADDETDAYCAARDNFRDIVSDSSIDMIDINVFRELKTPEHVAAVGQGWDTECHAYGDTRERIKDVLIRNIENGLV